MPQIAATLPEPRYQSTKRKVSHANRPAGVVAAASQMQGQAAARPAEKAKESKAKAQPKKLGDAIMGFWPVAVAIFLTGFAPELHGIAAQFGTWALRLAFPLSEFAALRNVGLPGMTPSMALYLQLPLDGLLFKLTLDRGRSIKSAAMQTVLVHGVATLVLWLITFLN